MPGRRSRGPNKNATADGPDRDHLGIPARRPARPAGLARLGRGRIIGGSLIRRSVLQPVGPPVPDDPVTVWIAQLQGGDPAAARPLWDRYFHRLVGLARKRLKDAPRRAADEEDVALSAFDSFCRNAEAGRFPDLADRDGLWRVLATFTLRKAAHYLRDAARLKRCGGAGSSGAIEEVLSREPSPSWRPRWPMSAAGCWRHSLTRTYFRSRSCGWTGIRSMRWQTGSGATPRSVKRKLSLIRKIWERESGDEPRR